MELIVTENPRDSILLTQLTTDLPYDKILESLSEEIWEPESVGLMKGYRQYAKRYTINGSKRQNSISSNPILKDITDYLRSDIFKNYVIDKLYETDFRKWWGLDKETMKNITSSWGAFVKDSPNTRVALHLDNRTLVATGMIYFIQDHQKNQQTTFYKTENKDDPLEIPTGLGKGWIAANSYNSWHEGINFSTVDRYSALIGISLNFNVE